MVRKNRESSRKVWLAVLVLLVIAAGVGYFVLRPDADTNTNSAISQQANSDAVDAVDSKPDTSTEVKEAEASQGTIIKSGDSDFGPMLFDSRGQAIYIWEVEESSTAECYGSCAEAWPPVLTDGLPVAKGDVKSELLGTTKRTDGTLQVTYNGHPLYFYANENPGEVECHNIKTHGGLWWVIQPSGVRAD